MMFLTPVIQTSTRIVSDSLCPMHLNALNNSSLNNPGHNDTASALCPPTYEEAVSFTLLKNLQTDYGVRYTTSNVSLQKSSSANHDHHQICDPPTYESSVSQNTIKPTNDESAIRSLQFNSNVSTENGTCTHNSGRLSIVSTTSITGFNVHRPPSENNRTRKRSIRHYTCVVFTTILALGIPTFIVLMTSGAISGLQHHTEKNVKNETKRSTFSISKSDGVMRRKREAVMEAVQRSFVRPLTDLTLPNLIEAKSRVLTNVSPQGILNSYDGSVNEYREFNSPQRTKRYHDMMYMINFTRMHSGLHDHKNFIKKLIENIMKTSKIKTLIKS